jgi:hypothetical protein
MSDPNPLLSVAPKPRRLVLLGAALLLPPLAVVAYAWWLGRRMSLFGGRRG